MKKDSLFKKIVLILMIIAIVVPNLLSTGSNYVYANEEDEDEEEVEASDSSSVSGNIYNAGYTNHGKEATGAIKKATEYDIRLQYLVTYAFLSQKYGQVGSNSQYNQLYTGGNVNGADDMNNYLNTSAQMVIDSVAEANDDEQGNGSAHDQSTSTENKGDIDEISEELADKLADKISDLLISHIGTDEKAYKDITKQAVMVKGWLGYESQKGTKYNLPKIKNGKRKAGLGGKNPKKFLKKKLKNHYANELKKSIPVEAKDDPNEVIKEVTRGRFLLDYSGGSKKITVSSLADKFRKDELGLKDLEKLKANVKHEKKDGRITLEIDLAAKIKEEDLKKYLSLYPKYTGDGIRDHIQKTVDDYLDTKEGNKLYKKYQKAIKIATEQESDAYNKVAGDSRILSYIILRPSLDIDKFKEDNTFGDFGVHEFQLLIEKVEKAKLDGNKIITDSGKDRSVQLNDLFYSKDKATPLFVMSTEETQNNYMSYFYGNTDKENDGISLGKYAGIQVKGKGFWGNIGAGLKNMTSPLQYKYSFKDIKKYGTGTDNDDFHELITRAIAASSSTAGSKMNAGERNTVSIDNYGNIINSTEGTILIPYWQNATTKTLINKQEGRAWISHPVFLEDGATKIIDDSGAFSKLTKVRESDITASTVNKAFSGVEGYTDVKESQVNTIKNDLENASNFSDVQKVFMKDGKPDLATIDVIAKMITAGTKNQVKEWNEEHAKHGEQGEELFVETDKGDYNSEGGVDNLEEYTNADLRERIMMILDYGFYEVLRLTFASMVVAIYNSGFADFTLGAVFHTTTIADTAIWSDIVRAVGLLIIGFMAVYIVWMAFRVFRQDMRLKDFFKQFLIVTLIILIPTVIYSPLINLTINKPTPMILGKQIQQSSILDTHLYFDEERRERDPLYAHMFGNLGESKDPTQDYIVDFYTTQHKSGFDITNPRATEGLGFRDQVRSARAMETGKWNKNDVIKVSVSIFDLFDWVRAMVDGPQGGDPEPYEPLFEWLGSHGDKSDRYEDITSFEEYSFDTNWLAKRLGEVDHENNEGRVTASDLFMELYRASADKDENGNLIKGGRALSDRIVNMYEISRYMKYTNDKEKVVTIEEVDALIRDLSLTGEARMTAFGETNSPREGIAGVSDKTHQLWERLGLGEELILPNSDYLNLERVIDDLVPVQDPNNTTKERYIYNVNEKVLNDYINVQSFVRDSVGSADSVTQAEFLMITLNEFFRLNEEVDIPMFPTTIKPETISLDSFVRMIYIPLYEYKGDPEGIGNLAEYLALRDNPILLMVTFLPALAALALWGLVYLVVFGVLMMVVSVVSFFWNYVIKQDTNNKSWLGSLMIIGTFALAKIGLLFLWFGMSYIMNYMYTRMEGSTYSYSFIHSIIILAYIVICFKFIFLKVFKMVRESPQDLGASKFLEGGRNIVGRMSNKRSNARNNSRGVKQGKSNPAIDDRLKNEGEKGRIADSAIGTTIRSVINKMKANGSNEGDVNDIATAASGTGSKISQRFPEMVKGFSGRSKKAMLESYDNIQAMPAGTGTAPDVLNALKESGMAGQILSTTADGTQIATMAVGDQEQAKMISSHLNDQGIDSRVNKKGDVVFASNEHDLSSPEVRKGMYGGLINDLYSEVDGASQVETNNENKPMAYTNNSDGTISMHVGDKGLSTTNLDNLMNSKAFSENFMVEGTPAKQENGSYVQGSLDIVPRKGADVDGAMQKIFATDDNMRSSSGEQARGDGNLNKSISYEGITEEGDVYSHLEDGMMVQEDKVLYDSKDRSHVKSINKITNEIRNKSDAQYNDKIDLMTKLSSQTALGGNNGFEMSYANTSQSKGVERAAKAAGLAGDNVESVVYAGDNAEKVANQVKSMKGFSQISPTEIQSYHVAQDKLFREGETMLLAGKGEDKYDKAINKLSKMAVDVGGDEGKINNFMDQYSELGVKKNNAELLPEEYNEKVEMLFNDMQLSMQDEGIYTKALTTEMSKNKKTPSKAKEALKEFTMSKRELTNKGVEPDMVDQLQNSDFNELMGTVDNVQDIEAREDGTIKITSDERLDEGDTARLIDKISKQ